MALTLAIIGRPNVGKSTLFNRLVGRRHALVDDTPGVTRDRRVGEARLGPLRFTVIDTAGLEDAFDDSLQGRMRRQTERAVEEADLALFLIDARAGVTPLDRAFATWLRRRGAKVLLAANKAEGRAGEAGVLEAYELGLGEPISLSAEHGEGMADLAAALLPHLAEDDAEPAAAPAQAPEQAGPEDGDGVEDGDGEGEPRTVRLTIVGRPNVGKSTLVNALLGEERMLTGPEPGLTRDAIQIPWQHGGRPVLLIDTAGLRRRARVTERLEQLSAAETRRAVRLANVVVLVLDADALLEKQDLTIARQTLEEGRSLVIAVNKWDLVADPGPPLKQLRDRLEMSLPQAKGLEVVTLSALRGRGLDRLMAAVFRSYEHWNQRIGTGPLNRWLAEATASHPPPLVAGRRLKLRYATQVKARPPTFALWTSRPDELPDSYLRYLINGIRERFDLPGVPIRILLRKGENPFAD